MKITFRILLQALHAIIKIFNFDTDKIQNRVHNNFQRVFDIFEINNMARHALQRLQHRAYDLLHVIWCIRYVPYCMVRTVPYDIVHPIMKHIHAKYRISMDET